MIMARLVRFLKLAAAIIVVLIAVSMLFATSPMVRHKQKQRELRKYAQRQWESPAAVHREGLVGSSPKFVVLFIHGFLGFEEFGWENGWNEYVGRFVPALQGLSYVVYHPGLNQTKDYQSFAQSLDVYQVRQHLEKVIEEVDKPSEESSLGGHSVAGLPILCIGHSNGAATLVSLVSQHPSLAQRIQSLVVWAPYADIREASTLARIKSLPGGSFIAGNGMRLLYAPMYDAAHPTPVDHVRTKKFPEDLPTLFIYSHNDHVVPFKNCELFKTAFAAHLGCEQSGLVSMLEMHSGGHNWMWQRVQLMHTKIDKSTLTEEQRNHAKRIKHESYLRFQDRSLLSATLHNFIKKHLLVPHNEAKQASENVFDRIFVFLKSLIK